MQRNREAVHNHHIHTGPSPPHDSHFSYQSSALAKVPGSLYTHIQYEPWYLQSNAIFIVLIHLQPERMTTQPTTGIFFMFLIIPDMPLVSLPGSPSLRSVSFCGEVGQVPQAGLENHVSHESPLFPLQGPNSPVGSNP